MLLRATFRSAIGIGPFFDQFDQLSICLTLASLYLLRTERVMTSAVVCGLGIMTKLFPGTVLLVALLILPRAQKRRYTLVVVAVCAGVTLPWLIAGRKSLYDFTLSRDAWETIWSYPEPKFPPIPRADSLAAPFRSDLRPYGWLSGLAASMGLASLWWYGRRDARRTPPEVLLSLLLVLLMCSKGGGRATSFAGCSRCFFVVYRPTCAFAICAGLLVIGNIEFAGGHVYETSFWISIFGRHGLLAGPLAYSLWKARPSVAAASAPEFANALRDP